MEHMDLQQPQKKSQLHAKEGKDDTSYSSEETGEHDLDLVDEHSWACMFNFRCYTETPQLDENLIVVCGKIIEDSLKAYDEISGSFKTKFGDLEEKQLCHQSSKVVREFRYTEENVKKYLHMAESMLPLFEVDVVNYIWYRENKLSLLKPADDQYDEKLEQLAKIPNVEKVIKWLLYDVKDDKAIEQRSGLNQRDMGYIIFWLMKVKSIYIPHIKEDSDEEQYDESEMEDLLIQHRAALKEVSTTRQAFESIETIVKKHADANAIAVFFRVTKFEGVLAEVVYWLTIMRRVLELLVQKDVINNGYDDSFFDDLQTVRLGVPRSCNLLDLA